MCVFDKRTNRVFRSSPEKLAAELGFYDFPDAESGKRVEGALSAVESEAAAVIRQVLRARSLANLSDEHRASLSLFAAVQFLRVKSQRETLEHLEDTLREFITRSGGDPENVEGFRPMSREQLRLLSIHMMARAHELAPHFYEKSWALLAAAPGTLFYLSDCPIVMTNTLNLDPHRGTVGLAVPGIEIYLPLASRLCLAIWCPSIEQTLRESYERIIERKWAHALPIQIPEGATHLLQGLETGNSILSSRDNVIHINSLQVIHSSRYVFAEEERCFALAKAMVLRDGSLRSSAKPQVT